MTVFRSDAIGVSYFVPPATVKQITINEKPMVKKFVEDDKIELKSVLNEKQEKEVVSFFNSKSCGDIYIGVANDGKVLESIMPIKFSWQFPIVSKTIFCPLVSASSIFIPKRPRQKPLFM